MTVRRVAAVDCGTNSVRLLIAEHGEGESGPHSSYGPRDIARRLVINRLGEGVDRTGRISEAALERTRRAFDSYAALVGRSDVSGIRVVATSATRDAENRADFVDLVRHAFGVDPDVVTGREEAELSYIGAMRSLPPVPGPVLVCDIGGGSTELIHAEPPRPEPPCAEPPGAEQPRQRASGADVVAAYSMDIGCVRLTERHLAGDPPPPPEVEAAVRDVRAALDDAQAHGVPMTGHATFVGLAGSVTTVAALALGLAEYRELDLHGVVVRREQVDAVVRRLLVATHAERAAEAVIHEGRVDVIGAGALVLDEILRRTGSSEVLVSEHDILDGIAWSVADRLPP